MSKLDDVLEIADSGFGWMYSEGATDTKPEVLLAETKQQIKDLILELIGEDKEIPHSLDEESRARFYRVSGQNFTKNELRQKVAEL